MKDAKSAVVAAALNEEILESLRTDFMHLTVMPTEKCNFRCTYCYEDFVRGAMSATTVEAVKRLISSRWPDLRHLHISWFGGEPLNASRIVFDIMDHVARTRPSNCAVVSDMTTNAFNLRREMLEKLVGSGVTAYQITLDGASQDHDSRRLQANGQGSFERIWQNLIAARASDLDFAIMLRVHVDRHTLARLPAFLAQLADAFGDDPRFSVFVRPIARLGGVNDARLAVLGRRQREALDGLMAQGEARGLRIVGRDAPRVCYAAKPNALVIRSDGTLAKCTVAFDLGTNKVGSLNPDGTVSIDVEKVRAWAGVFARPEPADLRCPLAAVRRG